MNEWIITRINSLKEDLSKKQECFKINIQNIDSPTYEDNTINDLLVMKKLKTEIEQLELMLQMNEIFHGGKGEIMRYFECVADKRVYTEEQLKTLFIFKITHGYDKSFDDWINEELRNGYLRVLCEAEIINMHIQKYNRG